MRFLTDMGLGIRVTEWLRAQGHDATHLRDEGLHTLSDHDIFAKAVVEQRVVLTLDLDFGEIAALAQGESASVVVFRTKNTRATYIIERLKAVLAQSSPALVDGAIVTVEDTRHRVRRLPVGE